MGNEHSTKGVNRRKLLKSGLGAMAGSVLASDHTLAQSEDPNAFRHHGEDFVDLLLRRRSKRFAKGFSTKSGPLKFESQQLIQPLTSKEEAFLCFCAAGITGFAKGDLIYDKLNDGQQMTSFIGRTIPSPDAACTSQLFVTNDSETYTIKRPTDLTTEEIFAIKDLAKEKRFEDIQSIVKVSLKSSRSTPPLEAPFNLAVNKWSLYRPGTSYFLPVTDYTFLYINSLLSQFETHTGTYLVDERRKFRPAGLYRFGKCSNNGHLNDCFEQFQSFTVEQVDMMVQRTYGVEVGAMIQNLSLASNYLGLGGFPNFAGHEFAWTRALGFRMKTMKASKYLGLSRFKSSLLKLFGQDFDIPCAVGLEKGGKVILGSYAPPYYTDMNEAVDAVLERKFGSNGVYGSRLRASAFARPESVGKAAYRNRPSSQAVSATKAHCRYIYETYGRFPAHMPAFSNSVGFQVGHVDEEFYRTHYKS